jgi:hypothetical protein
MHWLVSFFGYDHATRADEESAPIESFVVDPMVGVIPHSDFIIGSRNSSVKFLNNNCFFFQFVECFPSLNVSFFFSPQHFVSVWVPEYLNKR